MTKYILQGGATGRKTEDNKKFFSEITNGLSDPINILCIYFAKDKKKWEELLVNDKMNFSSASPQKVLNFVLADEETDVLINQIKSADVIYLRGGNSHILKKYLDKVANLEQFWKDKVVAGSSAGALVLSKYFYENDDDTYNEGLGILPFKIFCHYSDEKFDKLEKLKQFGENFEVRTISEEKFFVVEY